MSIDRREFAPDIRDSTVSYRDPAPPSRQRLVLAGRAEKTGERRRADRARFARRKTGYLFNGAHRRRKRW